jgi:tetratricopeptide (TPR) repeat protein
MKVFFRLVIVVFISLGRTYSFAQTDLEKGITYFDNRAETHENLVVDSTNINLAIDYFTKSIVANKDVEKAYDYLLLSYYYKGAFVVRTKDGQKSNYLLGTTLGEKAIQLYPKNPAILLWYIANFSKYGEAKGIVSSAKEGLADKIKTYTKKLMDLDPEFADGAPHKLMGVINYKVPNIPFFLTWPSKEVAEEHLIKAIKINPKSISNIYYYAEFLVGERRNQEAKILLEKIISASPREDALIEDLYDIDMAKKLLAKITK